MAIAAGLDADIPDDLSPLKVREGVTVRRWPTIYVTSRVQTFLDLWRMKRDGVPIRSDAGMAWPAPLVAALRALDFEQSLLR